jgi:Flp pilus assembly protein TadD
MLLLLDCFAPPGEALRAAEAALAINPNSPSAHMARANAESYLRKFEQAKSDVQQAMRLSPRDPNLANGTTSWLTLNSVSGISTP